MQVLSSGRLIDLDLADVEDHEMGTHAAQSVGDRRERERVLAREPSRRRRLDLAPCPTGAGCRGAPALRGRRRPDADRALDQDLSVAELARSGG
jgi:hypothetical protein